MLGEQLFMSLKVIALGLGTVFVALILLIYVIELINKVLNIEIKSSKKKSSQVDKAFEMIDKIEENSITEVRGENIDDEEIIAVITAAIAASLHRSTHDIIVKSVKRIPNRAPAWNQVSRQQQIATRL